MKLKSINILNYKSIENLIIEINQNEDNSYTYGIIGENEVGKSSILKAIALIDNLDTIKVNRLDFNNKENPIEVFFDYEVLNSEKAKILELLNLALPDNGLSSVERISIELNIQKNTSKVVNIKVKNKYLINTDNLLIPEESDLYEYIDTSRQKISFWSFDDKYLISKEINLTSFLTNPKSISIPLYNCFILAGYKDDLVNISESLSDSTDREAIKDTLGDAVTAHLKRVWKNHKVKITFDITPTTLNFHIKDEGSKSKAKTIEQRSDGFRQFLSFLLTISAESANSDLNNTILLLDEPETHLHPQAQEELLQEFIKLTQNNNNILFFATHSNYLIDKKNLERNFKVEKTDDKCKISWFEKKESSYASINFDVFGISSDDYHNELYDFIRVNFSDFEEEKKRSNDIGINKFDELFLKQGKKLKKEYPCKGNENSVTLPTYVRNCIHYPSNKRENFDKLLIQSIELLRKYKEELSV